MSDTVGGLPGVADRDFDPAPDPALLARARSAAPGDSSRTAEAGGGGDELTFADILDIINPLQHIPIVSNIYRALTGDTIGPAARVIGGGLFGGPLGAVGALANALVEEATGMDTGEHVIAALSDEPAADDAPSAQVTLAAATAPSAAAQASPQPPDLHLAAVAPRAGPMPVLADAPEEGPGRIWFVNAMVSALEKYERDQTVTSQ